jgi:hypothetical protein
MRAAYAKSYGTYGVRRLHAELADEGLAVGRDRVRRLMRQAGLEAKPRRRRTSWPASRPLALDVPNVLARRFTVSRPDEVWVADTTEFQTGEGTLYLAAVLDLYARRVIGWSASASMHRSLAIDALTRALHARGDVTDVLHHSDQGSTRAPSTEHYSTVRASGRATAAVGSASTTHRWRAFSARSKTNSSTGASSPRTPRPAALSPATSRCSITTSVVTRRSSTEAPLPTRRRIIERPRRPPEPKPAVHRSQIRSLLRRCVEDWRRVRIGQKHENPERGGVFGGRTYVLPCVPGRI